MDEITLWLKQIREAIDNQVGYCSKLKMGLDLNVPTINFPIKKTYMLRGVTH